MIAVSSGSDTHQGIRAGGARTVSARRTDDRDAHGRQSPDGRGVATKLAITHVEAEVLPERKIEVVRDLRVRGRKVAMEGDGVNDAPGLNTSHATAIGV